ncbi:S8 family serine peptidase [Pengzhenrongella sicca]|uniref:S8 family serine peptidase n=1 Tax=Pengzhenrongella sicca TaxID=2819238 RepID=UPI001D0C6748|nr:S8 family serine peptidase [Pengzhenrongella sicca]
MILAAALALPAAAVEPPDPSPSPSGGFTAEPLTPGERLTAPKSPSSRLAQTDPELLARTDSEPVGVVIKLDHDAAASYTGDVAGLAATSPSVTGEPLTGDSAAEEAYTDFQETNEAEVVSELTAAVPTAVVGESLRTVYGGVAATIPADSVEAVLALDGVTAVQKDSLHQLTTDSSPEFINAGPAYYELGGTANAGEGVLYGNLDSGVWPEHPSLADQGNLKPPPGPARECDFGDNPLTPEDDPFVCTNKLVGGAAFLDTYLSSPERADAEMFHTARDSDGHGTHTSTTSAGNIVEEVSALGTALAPIHGIAPGAWVMEYKVCGMGGCFSSDSAAAVGQAIIDGVDVINFSISGGTSPFTDPVELAFLDAYAAGITVSTSAGNDGPGAATANHLSPWVISVGASSQTREFATTLTLTAEDGTVATFDGASLTSGIEELPVVLASAAPYSSPLCDVPAPPGTLTGMIVACERGGNGRVEKGYNVLQGGAAAMVLYNPTLADTETDSHWLPVVHLADGADFLTFMGAKSGVTGSFPAGEPREGQGDVMAAFSSRGPAGLFIKPDVTAPGVQILAGDTPVSESVVSGPPGEYFQAIAGTSMSSPQVAGAAVLIKAVHPTWTPGQIKSALMTTSITDVLKEDTVTPADPFDMGAGRIDVGNSIGAVLTFDETADRYFALGDDPVNAVHLNLPSINAPVMPGRLTTTRTVVNTGKRTVRATTSADTPAESRITVTPKALEIKPGESATITITIGSVAPIGAQQFGSVVITPRHGGALHLPVAFIHTQGDVSLEQTCTPTQLRLWTKKNPSNTTTTCTVEAVNNSADDQVVSLDTTTTRSLLVTGATGATVANPHKVELHDVTLAGSQPGVPSVASGASPAGYLPLDAFGIAPIAVGDEEVVNLDVPAFAYNGRSYSSIGVTSNGYLVAGGATSEDLECCNLPNGPDPARPNDLLAPFWTDLDGTGAPGVFAGVLTDGVNRWVVVEFRLNVFGTTSQRVFEVWLGATGDPTPAQDVSFAYDPANLPADPAGQAFLVGAENGVGDGAVQAVLPTTDLVITSTDPVPGDVASYTFKARAAWQGIALVRTEMVASGVPGVTVEQDQITVKKIP